ncbi:MAG: AAA family ATPase [Elusimicrobia bacterium]|jgi:capsular exopolysaccharide synthesis family protein|nr:AAA family ATPase [Elusimicrobiota bacterium]
MASQDYTIYDYWRILKRRKWTIIFTVIIVLVSSTYFISRKKPIYRASAECEISSIGSGGSGQMYYVWYSGQMLETEKRIVSSRIVLEKTLKNIEQINENISPRKKDEAIRNLRSKLVVTSEGNTNILKIQVTSQDAQEVAPLANSVTQAYIETSDWRKQETNKEMRTFMSKQLAYVSDTLKSSEEALLNYKRTGSLKKVKEDFTARLSNLRIQLKDIKSQYTEEHPAVLDLEDRIRQLKETLSAVSKEALVQSRLEREIAVNEELYIMLNKKYKEILMASAGEAPKIRVINPAILPQRAVKRGAPLNYGMSVIIGLIFGMIIAFFKENLDTSIGTIEELEEFLKLPVLGVIPYFTADKSSPSTIDEIKDKAKRDSKSDLLSRLVMIQSPKSSIAEAYRTLEINVDFSKSDKEDNTLLFTSTTMKEGKSITVSNFALAAANSNKKVLLIEADFRAPVLHTIFGVDKENGLSEILLGKLKVSEAVKGTSDFLIGHLQREKLKKSAAIDNFHLITSGQLPPQPIQLLKSREFDKFLKEVKPKYDLIIFDSPPVLPVADATVISSRVGGVVVVYRVGTVIRGALKRAITQMTKSGANIMGVVLNQIRAAEMKSKDSYYRYYHKYYGREEKQPTKLQKFIDRFKFFSK